MAADFPTYPRISKAYPGGGYIYTGTPEELAAQRGILWELAKSFGKNLVGAKDLIGISLPVGLFEPRSYLERLADGWWSAPHFLTKASKTTNPLERLKLVMTFLLSGLFSTCDNQKGKPFNPILGETYEASFEDGTRIYAEQTSHHPPVTSWQVFGPDNSWYYYGFGEWTAAFRGNSVKGHQLGPHFIQFPDGTEITFSLPEANVSGILFGDRIIEYIGVVEFRDEKNGLSCDLHIPPKESEQGGIFGGWFASKSKIPTDYFRGEILQWKQREDFANMMKKGFSNAKSSEYTNVGRIQGSWLSCIEIDGEKWWDIHDDSLKKYLPIRVEEPLPSDSRYRLDTKFLAAGDLEQAAEFKRKHEVKQRKEASLRKEGYEIRKKERAAEKEKRIVTVADFKKQQKSAS